MKVILLQDVKGTGKKGQLIEASDGHARNYLIPKNLAVEATKANMTDMENKKQAVENKKKRDLEHANDIADKLKMQTVTMKVKCGENGKLFGSVTNKEIAAELQSLTGLDIDRKKVILPEPIKTTGTRQIEVKLYQNISVKVTVEIVGI